MRRPLGQVELINPNPNRNLNHYLTTTKPYNYRDRDRDRDRIERASQCDYNNYSRYSELHDDDEYDHFETSEIGVNGSPNMSRINDTDNDYKG